MNDRTRDKETNGSISFNKQICFSEKVTLIYLNSEREIFLTYLPIVSGNEVPCKILQGELYESRRKTGYT